MNESEGIEPLYDPNDLTYMPSSDLAFIDPTWSYRIDFSEVPFFERLRQILRFIIKGKMEFKM